MNFPALTVFQFFGHLYTSLKHLLSGHHVLNKQDTVY